MTRPEWIEKFSSYCRANGIRYALARSWNGSRGIKAAISSGDITRLSEFSASPELRVAFMTELSCFGLSYMSVRDVLLRAEEQDGVFWMNDVDQALILLVSSIAGKNSDMQAAHLSFLQRVLRDNPNALGSRIVEILGEGTGLDILEGIESGKLSARNLSQAHLGFILESTKTRGVLYWGLYISAYYARVFRDWLFRK
jgi:hypothetical protein